MAHPADDDPFEEVCDGLERAQVRGLYTHYVRATGMDPMSMFHGEIVAERLAGDTDTMIARMAMQRRQEARIKARVAK